jgi:tetratricopeptide (TPR) repeat protein
VQLRFGDKLVWQDVDDIALGADFEAAIQKAIKTADAILVVIGPYWQPTGLERLRDPKDVLRMEIGQALKSKATVIPVLVGNAAMPQAKDLPAPIADLVKRNGEAISDADWVHGVQVLIERLQQIVRAKRATEPLSTLYSKLAEMEARFFQLMDSEPRKALDIAHQVLGLLDEQMPHYPLDIYLQLERGYFLKNEAMVQREVGNHEGFQASLTKAEQVFNTMRDESAIHLASAYNGMGSVELLRMNFKEALEWIDRALELVPDYPQALHDRQMALTYVKNESNRSGRRVRKRPATKP